MCCGHARAGRRTASIRVASRRAGGPRRISAARVRRLYCSARPSMSSTSGPVNSYTAPMRSAGSRRMAATTAATSAAAIGDVRAGSERQRKHAAVPDGLRRQHGEQRVLEESRWADMNYGQSRPVEHMFGQPVQPLMLGLVGARQCHLRHRHLRHVDDHFEVAALAAPPHTPRRWPAGSPATHSC